VVVAPDPDGPNMFRCAAPGYVSVLYEGAGLRDVAEWDVDVELVTRSPEQYWEMISEHVSLAVAALQQVDEPCPRQCRDADDLQRCPRRSIIAAPDRTELIHDARVPLLPAHREPGPRRSLNVSDLIGARHRRSPYRCMHRMRRYSWRERIMPDLEHQRGCARRWSEPRITTGRYAIGAGCGVIDCRHRSICPAYSSGSGSGKVQVTAEAFDVGATGGE